MSDDMEQVHNESIYMTYLGKIYMNIAPIGHNFSVAERQNLPYSVMLGFIFSWNIVITTQCSGWGSSSFFIKPQKYDNSHQNNDLPKSILHVVIKKHIILQRLDSANFLCVLLHSLKASLIPPISP